MKALNLYFEIKQYIECFLRYAFVPFFSFFLSIFVILTNLNDCTIQMNRSGMVGGKTNQQQNLMQKTPQQPLSFQSNEQQHHSSGIFSTATNLLSGASNTASGGLFGNRPNHPKGPQVIPQTGSNGGNINQQQQNSFNSK